MQPGRGEFDEDIVDRIKTSGTNDPLTIEAMQEVVYIRAELAKQIRDLNKVTADIKRKAL
jgi:sugar phosphate isomerase/epimerase